MGRRLGRYLGNDTFSLTILLWLAGTPEEHVAGSRMIPSLTPQIQLRHNVAPLLAHCKWRGHCSRMVALRRMTGPPRLGLNFLAPSFHNTTALKMQRVVPQRARQLWGHAPRVRSFKRRHRTFATVSGASQYEAPIALTAVAY